MKWNLALFLVISIFNFFYAFVALAYDLATKQVKNDDKMFAYFIFGLAALFLYLISM